VKRCSVVTKAKRKLLIRLGQNGMWPGPEASNSSGADGEPPAYGRDLNHSGTSAERGNPVVFPASLPTRRGKPLARAAHETAGVGSGSKQMPLGNGADRG
jgi:hypothetical protein